MDSPSIRRLLLDLLGTPGRAGSESLQALSESDWSMLDGMASQHRLRPLLHASQQDNLAIPEAVREGWRSAHRQSGMAALTQKAELAECCALLRSKGFEPIALKGAYLAWHAYPSPAQRPLRDLDLLLTPDTVIPAFHALTDAGYTLGEVPELALEDLVRLDKHMPVLIAPRGTPIELHHRLSMPQGRLDHDTPDSDEAAIRERSIVIDEVRYPEPRDMLAHLIVHAVYGHRLNCGPLVLADIAQMLATHDVDHASFLARAKREGWLPGAVLLFELTRRYYGETAAPAPPTGFSVPEGMFAAAPDLLLQDLETRKSAGFIAASLAGGPAGLARRILGRKAASGQAGARKDMAPEGGFVRWAWSRLDRTVSDLRNAAVRQQSRDLARLSRWLDK
ncbi:MAG: nucleotidyltransferase family protein [Novosphingobium sp.]|nr:nucleotidyltransferase family protein [Novosphingobium sp.]